MKKLIFVDIDETLFFTKAKILVKDKTSNKVVKELTNQDFNTYKLADNEYFDFIQFKSADLFVQTSEPNKGMINTILELQKNPENEIVLLTARQDFDNKEKLLKFFKDFGINVGHYKNNEIHIVRVGNMSSSIPVSIKKRITIEKIMHKTGYHQIEFYDDNNENLEEFLKLKILYPKRTFKAFKVHFDNLIEM